MEKLRADVARLTREVEYAVEIVEHLQDLHAAALAEAEQLRYLVLENRDLKARLAAVEAVKAWPTENGADSPWVRGYNAALRNVRAAAAGEGDRG